MSLSNTATPKYYGEFREQVLNGDILVCKEISMQMNLIDARIRNPGIYYDPEPVEKFILFCEEELVLTDGRPFFMLPTFKLWAEDLLGWYYFIDRSVYVPNPDNHGGRYVRKRVKHRLINKQYLVVGRGAAKSLYDTAMQAYFLTVDDSTNQQITTAPTMKLAEEVTRPFETAITIARGPYFKFLTYGSLQNTTGKRTERQKLASTKQGIQNFLNNSILQIRPMSISKLQGLRCKVATVDEWLSCDIREDPVGAIEQGASKVKDWLIICTSSEGTIRNAAGDDIKIELMKILKGEYVAPHTSIWWYKLDDIKEIRDPGKWIKANPNLGKTVTYDTYQLDVERAEQAPAARNDILAKRFGLPMEGYTYFFSYGETLHGPPREFWGMKCAMGADLSQGDDFCAFTFLFPLRGGMFGVKTRCYITEQTLRRLSVSMRRKYEDFINEGSLIVMPGTMLDMMDIYEDLDEFITQSEYDVNAFGYDPYNAKAFVERWERENGGMGIEKVIQGSKTESVPLGEIKKLAEDRMLVFDQEILTFTMGNCMVVEDTNGNRKLLKMRYDRKIDAVAAMMDALVAYKVNKDMFD